MDYLNKKQKSKLFDLHRSGVITINVIDTYVPCKCDKEISYEDFNDDEYNVFDAEDALEKSEDQDDVAQQVCEDARPDVLEITPFFEPAFRTFSSDTTRTSEAELLESLKENQRRQYSVIRASLYERMRKGLALTDDQPIIEEKLTGRRIVLVDKPCKEGCFKFYWADDYTRQDREFDQEHFNALFRIVAPAVKPTPMPEWLERQITNVEVTVGGWSVDKRESAGIPELKISEKVTYNINSDL